MGSILKAGEMSSGAWEAVSVEWIWYLNATWVLWMLARLMEYSPSLPETGVTKAGLGATFSRLEKFSRRMLSVLEGEEKSAAL